MSGRISCRSTGQSSRPDHLRRSRRPEARSSTSGRYTCPSCSSLFPLPEQAALAAYLEETAKLDALVGKVEEAVERLQEYRTALITAAVTGKIDVRADSKLTTLPP